jgi:hypothetical protein
MGESAPRHGDGWPVTIDLAFSDTGMEWADPIIRPPIFCESRWSLELGRGVSDVAGEWT